MDQIERIIAGKAEKYHAARQVAQDAAADRLEAQETLNQLTTEAAGLRRRLSEFEAGDGEPMSADDFQTAAYRIQWLTGAIRAQERIKKQCEEQAQLANLEVQNIHTAARGEIDAVLREEANARAAVVRAQLAEAFRIPSSPEMPRPGKINEMPVPVPARF